MIHTEPGTNRTLFLQQYKHGLEEFCRVGERITGRQMDLDQEQLYSEVQELFRKGLVIIVGSGASSALGLPGMTDLAAHLRENVPNEITARSLSCLPQWTPISELLEQGQGLEDALADGVSSDELADLIAEQIATCISGKEMHAMEKILREAEPPAFSRIFQHVLRTTECVDVITTNYDRLIEAQAARVGIGVDSMFYGHTVGKFDPEQSRKSMLRLDNQVGRRRVTSIRKTPHIRLSKPHGSLDWLTYNGEHFRSDLAIPGARRIVAPGGNKYRQGYEMPFDQQRERANAAIDAADALLFVGYGFNDDHLQTHIRERIQKVPSVILSRTITQSAREYLSISPVALGVEADRVNDAHTHVVKGDGEATLDSPIWNLNRLVEEVLGK